MYILNGLYMFLIGCKFFFDIQLFPRKQSYTYG